MKATSTAADALQVGFQQVRAASATLVAELPVEDLGLQPMADASPLKWHLAHTSWFFETFLLKPFLQAYQVYDPAFEYLFNSYYNGVGAQYPRERRGQMSRPTVATVLDYRRHVDAAMARLLAVGANEEVVRRTHLGMHHEMQHQELMVTDLKYALGTQPTRPVLPQATLPPADHQSARPLSWTRLAGGLTWLGADADGDDFVFDNETPRHRVWVDDFLLADRCITVGEYLAFMADGGYQRSELWLADGWAWLGGNNDGPCAPLYWYQQDGTWWHYTLAGARPLPQAAPVCHISAYEADAFARWAGARLPTEAEWEVASMQAGAAGNWFEDGNFEPGPDPGGPLAAMLGGLWEWTSSAYGPYPGYRPLPGALGEYNGKFMCNQLVLRGGSCASPRLHVRRSYRNFFHPPDRWQYTGIRLARDP